MKRFLLVLFVLLLSACSGVEETTVPASPTDEWVTPPDVSPETAAKIEVFFDSINPVCFHNPSAQEECYSDKLFQYEFHRFASWLKEKGYSYDVLRAYRKDAEYIELRKVMMGFFYKHKKEAIQFYRNLASFKNSSEIELDFYEIFPTDSDTEHTPLPAEFINEYEKYLETRLGKEFKIKYTKQEINYKKTFGELLFTRNFSNSKEISDFTYNAVHPCMYYFNINKINEKHPAMIIEIRQCSLLMKIPDHFGFDLEQDQIHMFDMISEELGHSFGMHHESVEQGDGELTLAGWMGYENKGQNENGCWVSPIMRYALEPEELFNDDPSKVEKGFGEVYNEAMAWKLKKTKSWANTHRAFSESCQTVPCTLED